MGSNKDECLGQQRIVLYPATKEDLLWEAVLYLSGIGLKIAPDKYMENEDGIKEMFDSYWS